MEDKLPPSRPTPTTVGFEYLVASLETMETSGALADEYERLPESIMFPCTVGKSERVAKKNRYKDVVPYDQNRVILCHPKLNLMDEEGDYINASFIRGFTSNDGFIATQGPMLGTVDNFWSMVWSENSRLVVMMCRLVENCQNQSYMYWPENGDSLDVDDVLITNEVEDERGTHIVRKLSLRHHETGEERQITHLQFIAWPDNSTPCLPTLMAFWKTFRRLKNSLTGPPVVHCSNGSQRTGLLIALDNLMNQWEATSSIDVYSCVLHLREDRVGFFPMEADYLYLYKAAVEAYLSRKTNRTQGTLNDDDCFAPYTSDLMPRMLPEDIRKEYEVFDKQRPKQEYSNAGAACNENGNILPSETTVTTTSASTMSYQLRFPRDMGTVYATCLPLNHQILRRPRFERPRKLKHSVSLQENEIFLGISGVLPTECKSSFLVTNVPTTTQTLDFWQMMFDTGCRTIVRLVESEQALDTQEDTFPLHTSDFSVELMSQSTLRKLIKEKSLLLQSEVEPTIPLDFDVPSQVSIKMFALPWSHDNHVIPSCDILFLLIKLITKWLLQSATPMIAVQCNDESASAHFCAAYNILSTLRTDLSVDVYLTTRAIQTCMPHAIDLAQYEHLHQLSEQFIVHRRSKLTRLPSNKTTVAFSDRPSLSATSSVSSTDE